VAFTAPLGAIACPTCGTTYDFGVSVCPKDGTALQGFKPPITGEHDPVIGQKLGDVVVEKRVAHGGMGIIYRALHPVIGRQFAVKVLRPEFAENKQQVERFLAEAKAISAIRHRGIVDVTSFGQLPDKRQYMVMEYLDGEPLDVVLAREKELAYNVALPLMDEILDALSAAHSVGVIHRDMKPSNVFLARQSNGTKQVKLVDFGLAKQTDLGDVHAQAYARASLVAGTPEYISPEQIRGEAPTARTDLYGFAVVAFEMLTHKLPFVGQTVVDTLEMHARRPPPHVKVFRGDVPPALDDLIFRLMSKRPEDRPSSAEAARQELQRLMREMNIDASLQPRESPTSPSLPEIPAVRHTLEVSPKKKVMLGVLGAVGVAGIAAAAFFLGRSPELNPAPAPIAAVAPGVVPAPEVKPADPPPTPEARVVDPPAALTTVDPPDALLEAKKKKAPPAKKKPFAELDNLSDDDWRSRMRTRLQKKWREVEARATKDNSSTATAKVSYEPLIDRVQSAKGLPARRTVQVQVQKWEEAFLK
jgi:serine/threonine protein kinase